MPQMRDRHARTPTQDQLKTAAFKTFNNNLQIKSIQSAAQDQIPKCSRDMR